MGIWCDNNLVGSRNVIEERRQPKYKLTFVSEGDSNRVGWWDGSISLSDSRTPLHPAKFYVLYSPRVVFLKRLAQAEYILNLLIRKRMGYP